MSIKNIIIGNTSYPPLKINDIETIGYLDKEILTEECFEINSLKGKNIKNETEQELLEM